jgi:hypothetical protein
MDRLDLDVVGAAGELRDVGGDRHCLGGHAWFLSLKGIRAIALDAMPPIEREPHSAHTGLLSKYLK